MSALLCWISSWLFGRSAAVLALNSASRSDLHREKQRVNCKQHPYAFANSPATITFMDSWLHDALTAIQSTVSKQWLQPKALTSVGTGSSGHASTILVEFGRVTWQYVRPGLWSGLSVNSCDSCSVVCCKRMKRPFKISRSGEEFRTREIHGLSFQIRGVLGLRGDKSNRPTMSYAAVADSEQDETEQQQQQQQQRTCQNSGHHWQTATTSWRHCYRVTLTSHVVMASVTHDASRRVSIRRQRTVSA